MSNPFYPYGYGHGAAGDGAGSGGYSSYEIDLIAARYGGGPLANPSSARAFDAQFGGPMRSAEVLYHQPIMGSRRTIGEIEALYSSNTMAKRPRLESSLPIYPQRPGAKQCTFYMTTRTCKYGDACKFDHPQWVPEGGIPDWKEVPKLEEPVLRKKLEESYPERAGEPDCPYFMKTKKCRFGSKCRFNHPKEKANELVPETGNEQESLIDVGHVFPVRPSEPLCSFYAKTGKCKFGVKCKFNHPKDIEIPSSQNNSEDTATVEAAEHIGIVDGSVLPKLFTPIAAAAKLNSKGLPIRPGEVDCAFYMRAGSCKYSTDCRFNHPDRPVLNFPLAAPLDPTIIPTVETMMLNPAANFMQNFDFHVPHIAAEPEPVTYPQRPGETVCDFYMKTGHCKFTERCKFHHPIDRSAPPAALPRREDAEPCAHYMKTGACKFGMKCKFDHPSDQEAVAKASGAGS